MSNTAALVGVIFGIIVVLIVAIIFGPIITIWALNTVFGLGIAYTFKTWLAVLFLTALFAPKQVSNQVPKS